MSTNSGAIKLTSDVVSPERPSDGNTAVTNGVKAGIEVDLLESNTETLIAEPSSVHHRAGSVAEGSIDDSRVSRDGGSVSETVDYEEKEGEYKVSDLVWAKVKSYPWWPGQIFDPSASTDKAKKHSRKDGFLIAYFGDQTFAWNEASKIKPFRKNFCKMEKQSNSKAFHRAVNCALGEVSRRVEFGLACSCLSEEVYAKTKTQVFDNAGIRKEDSRIEGGDNFSTVATFNPVNVVRSVQDLAKEHFDGISRLEVSSVRAQLLAFYRWKGYHQFSSHHLLDGSDDTLEDNAELPVMEEDKVVETTKPDSAGGKVLSKRKKSNAHENVSKKRQNVGNGGTTSTKKKQSLTRLIPNGDKSKRDGGKRTIVEPNGFKEENPNRSSDGKSLVSSPKTLFRVGDSICRIAKQLTQSPPVLKKESQMREKNSIDKKHDEQTEENVRGLEVTESSDGTIPRNPDDSSPKKSKKNSANSATALILKFTNLDSIPSVTNLNEIFSRYGPVKEMETEVLKKNNCVKVVFETPSNAETAFSSAGKFSIFGPSLISYRLDYSPMLKKASTPGRRENRKDQKSAKEVQSEE